MTVEQVIENLRLEQEKGLEHRFCCRAIMVKNIVQYIDLLDHLRKLPYAEVVPASYLFDGNDILPCYENLTSSLYYGKWLILPGVSEYLRFFSVDEGESRRFDKLWGHTWPANNKGRIIIPLWGCEGEWHDKSLHFMDKIIRADEVYFDCTDDDDAEQHLNVSVLSADFRNYKNQLMDSNKLVIDGLRAWYEYWSNPSADLTEYVLITSRINFIQSINGHISVRTIKDTLSFMQENMHGGNIMTVECCPEEAQECLFEKALEGLSVDVAIMSCLNIEKFSAIDVMSKWGVFTDGKKQLTKLWYHLHPDDSYLSSVMIGSKSIFDVEKNILHSIFKVNMKHPYWIEESRELIKTMKLEIDEDYLEELAQIPSYEEQLKYLSGTTAKERSCILKIAGKIMRESERKFDFRTEFESVYPALCAYLDETIYDEELKRYMTLYKTYKLSNTLPDDEQMYFANMQIENYGFRYAAIHDVLNEQSIVLWIDALGVEWLPLLIWSLNKSDCGKIQHVFVTQANLPTETKFNEQWKQMKVSYDKSLNRLDKLAHNGVIDDSNYYSCVEKQIEFVSNAIKEKVHSLLKEYKRVIITGDHGTSRLAARIFHKKEGVPFKNGKPLSHGRYGLVTNGEYQINILSTQISAKDEKGNSYVVFKNYDHFKLGGFAAGADDDNATYGEIHGGATPEEVLVPVVVFDSNNVLPLLAEWLDNPVKIFMKKAKCRIRFNQPVNNLQVKLGTNDALTSLSTDKKEWLVEFLDIKSGMHHVSVVADGRFVSIDDLVIKSALSNDGGDLP